jgi:hypothetical protein
MSEDGIPEMATGARALAVMRRNEKELLHEAWLYHHPHLRVVSFGMEVTKTLLQRLIESNDEDVYRQHVDAQDIADALATAGQDVVVFFIIKKDAIVDVSPGFGWFFYGNPEQKAQPPSAAARAGGTELGLPPPGPGGVPIPQRPLPPYLEAPLGPGMLTVPDLQCLATLYGIFHWGLSAAVLPDIATAQPISMATGIEVVPNTNVNSPIYDRFVMQFTNACTSAFGSFGEPQKVRE